VFCENREGKAQLPPDKSFRFWRYPKRKEGVGNKSLGKRIKSDKVGNEGGYDEDKVGGLDEGTA